MHKCKSQIVILAAILFISSSLAACSGRVESLQAKYNDSDAVYRLAWQYIIDKKDKDDTADQISDAALIHFDLVETCKVSHQQTVYVYSLEYSFFTSEKRTWIPGEGNLGSPYLFIINDNGFPKIIGVKSTREILAYEDYRAAAIAVFAENKDISFAKTSSSSTPFSREEIDAAIQAATDSIASDECFVINIWYDSKTHLELSSQYKDNSLYGMDKAKKRGDLIILCSDVYTLNEGNQQLFPEWKIVLIRDSRDSPWEVVTQGY